MDGKAVTTFLTLDRAPGGRNLGLVNTVGGATLITGDFDRHKSSISAERRGNLLDDPLSFVEILDDVLDLFGVFRVGSELQVIAIRLDSQLPFTLGGVGNP